MYERKIAYYFGNGVRMYVLFLFYFLKKGLRILFRYKLDCVIDVCYLLVAFTGLRIQA